MAVRWRRLAIDVLIAVLAISGVTLVVIGASPPPESGYRQAGPVTVEGPPGPPARGTTRSSGDKGVSPGTTPRGNGEPAPLGPSVPVHLDIPAIGVSTPLITLGLNADGTIAVPPLQRDAPAGWYRYLATPGEVGPAVILGHVDTARDGPAVFYRLHQLRPGDTVGVRRMDASTAVFTVRQVAEYPKSAFPAQAVYGPLDYPALRLVTCGGSFDRMHQLYRANVVVYATLTATKPA